MLLTCGTTSNRSLPSRSARYRADAVEERIAAADQHRPCGRIERLADLSHGRGHVGVQRHPTARHVLTEQPQGRRRPEDQVRLRDDPPGRSVSPASPSSPMPTITIFDCGSPTAVFLFSIFHGRQDKVPRQHRNATPTPRLPVESRRASSGQLGSIKPITQSWRFPDGSRKALIASVRVSGCV